MDHPNFTWISPYDPSDARGGWKAMQFHLLRALEAKLGTARRIAPVEVPEELFGKWVSRGQKKLGIPRRYTYYSDARLAAFDEAVSSQLPKNGNQPVVFFGPLPFVKCRPKGPYYIYTDGAFFIHYWEYNRDHSHSRKDIARITEAEAEFMRHAARVWCSSQKVADRVILEYRLAPGQAIFVGTGPGNVPSSVPTARYENYLVLIGADFERKGGRLAVESVVEARNLGADITIKFIGAKPPADVLVLPFVEWCGWLDMKKESDRSRFAEVMSGAGAQILLSRHDLTPLAIVEASVYSKATMAAAVGGIPEMILDEQTGWLIGPEATAKDIGGRIASLFLEPNTLDRAGVAAFNFYASGWNWETVATRCISSMRTRNPGLPD
ncbi:MAG TPA: glycosyltransferase [Candidatus Acidoferrum sp.]|nr:glycosyltransferase [Candidatus Acidoferrum sp.]